MRPPRWTHRESREIGLPWKWDEAAASSCRCFLSRTFELIHSWLRLYVPLGTSVRTGMRLRPDEEEATPVRTGMLPDDGEAFAPPNGGGLLLSCVGILTEARSLSHREVGVSLRGERRVCGVFCGALGLISLRNGVGGISDILGSPPPPCWHWRVCQLPHESFEFVIRTVGLVEIAEGP